MRNTTRTARRLVLPLALVAVTAVAGAACSSDSSDEGSKDASSTTAAEKSTTTTAADGEVITAAGPIELSVDGRATIRLDANPTTGYQWEPVAAPDESVIRVVSDHYRADDSNVVGSGGTQEIVLEGTGAGTTTFELQYVRPWETGVAPAETASFAVTVR